MSNRSGHSSKLYPDLTTEIEQTTSMEKSSPRHARAYNKHRRVRDDDSEEEVDGTGSRSEDEDGDADDGNGENVGHSRSRILIYERIYDLDSSGSQLSRSPPSGPNIFSGSPAANSPRMNINLQQQSSPRSNIHSDRMASASARSAAETSSDRTPRSDKNLPAYDSPKSARKNADVPQRMTGESLSHNSPSQMKYAPQLDSRREDEVRVRRIETSLRRRSLHDGNEVDVDVYTNVSRTESVHHRAPDGYKYSAQQNTVYTSFSSQPNQWNCGVSLFAGLIVFFVCVVGICFFINVYNESYEKSHVSNDKGESMFEEFQSLVKDMQLQFPAQTNDLWKVLRIGTRPILMQTDPEAPAVFIVVASSNDAMTRRTTECLARSFANVVTKSFKSYVQYMELESKMDGEPRRVKELIDETLEDGFSRGSRAAIVHEVEALHGEAAMMFHAYCDNENAKHSRVAILFTLFGDEDGRERNGDKFVEDTLKSRWRHHIDRDKVDPLLSRIGNSNVFVRGESEETLAAIGC